MRTLVKILEGFEITFEPLEEFLQLDQLFEPDQVEEIQSKIDNGELILFCAKVSSHKFGVELAYDILGGCVYGSYAEFYTEEDGYFDDMAKNVVEAAKEKIKQLA